MNETYHSWDTYQSSAAWKDLLQLRDMRLLKKLARSAKYNRFRWKACKMSGGHILNKEAANKCKCRVCGFQYHTVIDNKCECCDAIFETIPFVTGMPKSIITFPDGTKETIEGYNGILINEISIFT